MHALLQKSDKIDILIIQEPWFYTVATIRSDADPEGTPQKGLPHNNMWDAHLPKHTPDDTCKVAIYTKKTLLKMHTIKLRTDHLLTLLTTMVLDVAPISAPVDNPTNPIATQDNTTIHVINLYHIVLERGHALCHLLSHTLDEMTPTLLIRNFN